MAAMTKMFGERLQRTRQFLGAVRETVAEATRLREEARRKWPGSGF